MGHPTSRTYPIMNVLRLLVGQYIIVIASYHYRVNHNEPLAF